MKARFRHGRSEGISFFAFQDIITGTSGILIVIALFLSLNLDQVIQVSTDADTAHQREGDLTRLIAQVAALKSQVAEVQKLPGEDAPTLQRMIEQLEDTVLTLSAPVAAAQSPVTPMSRDRQIEYQKLLTATQEAEASIETARQRAAKELALLPDLENQVKDAQSRLQASRDRQNVLRLIPERTDTTKEPILILVRASRFFVQRFDGSEAHAAASLSAFLELLQAFSPTQHYIVLYFKPSGAPHFERLTSQVREAGFEIGYDVVPEDIEFEFTEGRR